MAALLGGQVMAGEPIDVAGLRRADEWLLDDGRVVRLASVVVPDLPATVEPAARGMMAGLATKRAPELEVLGRAPDRYGRVLGTMLVEQGVDVRVPLLHAGLAIVRTGDEPADAVRRLLEQEALGRAAGRGVWGELDQCTVAAGKVGDRIGRFVRAEGKVVSVAERWEATFLDFGADWRTDFTIRVRKADLPAFAAAGLDLPSLAGRKVVARGWPFFASGPMLELRDPLELQPIP